jgi:putative hemolysin
MSDLWTNTVVVLVFILVGGLFAGAEIALVSLREGQLRTLAERGRRGERVAALAGDPNRFLSAVQIGVTVAGFFSAAFGAATLAGALQPSLVALGVPESVADTLAVVAVTLIISFVSLVLGELVPKRLALQRSEGWAYVLGPPLDVLSQLVRPVIWLLSRCTDVVVRLLGGDPSIGRDQISSEELRELVTGHQDFGEDERRIVTDVFEAGDRQVREVMLPRTEVDFLDADLPAYQAARQIAERPHSRYPVIDKSPDDVVGFVHVRDLLAPDVVRRSVPVRELARPVMSIPGTKPVLASLTELREVGAHLAIVVDEYGGTAGIVTFEDLVEELVGDIYDEYDVPGEPEPAQPQLGEVDGLLNLDEFAARTGVHLPEGPYETVAGFVMARLGRVPAVGDRVAHAGHELTVVAMDGRRVQRLDVARADDGADEGGSPASPPDEAASDAVGIPAGSPAPPPLPESSP